MASTYGSDNPDCVKVDRLGDGFSSVHSRSSPWKRAALATAGAALCLGGALVMYEGWNSPFNGVGLETTASVSATTLESAATSTDQTNLMSGQAVLLRIKGKTANLCADDGGSTKPDVTFVTGQPCNPSNPNQLFIYDSTTYQFKSAKKANLCLDDGGGWAGFTWFRLSTCDSKSEDQRYAYDATTRLFENPSKKGYCMDDGGATSSGATKYTFWYCSSKSSDQQFEVLSQSTLAEEQKKVLNAVAGGAKFILRIAGKEGLCASGSGTATASTSFVPAACDKTSKNQLFSYDASTNRFKAAEKSGLCLDDGGGTKAAKTDVRLTSCSTSSVDQSFNYNSTTMVFTQPNKAKLCLDDGSGVWFTAPRLILKECDAYNVNQHFEYVLQTEPVVAAPVTATTTTWTSVTPQTATSSVVSSPTTATTTTTPTSVDTLAPQTATSSVLSSPVAQYTSTSTQQVASYTETTTQPVTSSTQTLSSPAYQDSQTSQTVLEPTKTDSEPSQAISSTATEPGVVNKDQLGDTYSLPAVTSSMKEPEVAAQQGESNTTSSTWTQPSTTETSMTEPEVAAQQGESTPTTSTWTQPGTTETSMTEPEVAAQQGELTPTTSTWTQPGTTETSMTEPEVAAQQSDILPSSDVGFPSQADADLPPPDVPVVKKADMPLAKYGNGDWNLLAPSNDTISIVNADNSAAISAAEIYQYLQTVKDKADVEHEVMMYRYKRTYQCATEGLKTLAKDAVTSDEYHVLVQWMYDHCAAGATDVAPITNPSPPTNDQLKKEDVAPLVDDKDSDVKRQFMTKLDFYYEIKNHYADKDAKMVGDAAVANLRSEETMALEQKLVDCIEEASERYGPSNVGDHLKDAISWVASTCMAS